mgnify:CR=1 FL=1
MPRSAAPVRGVELLKIEWNKKYTTIAAYVLIVVAIGIAIYQLFDNLPYFHEVWNTIVKLMMPFILGVCFAYIFYPVLHWVERTALPFLTRYRCTRRFYRGLGILLTVLFVVAVILVLFSFVIPELLNSVNGIISQITAYAPNVDKILTDFLARFHLDSALAPAITSITSSIESFFSQAFDLLSKSLSGIINATISTTITITYTVINIFIGIIISIYLWSSKETFFAQTKKLCYAYFPQTFVDKTISLLHEANRIFSGFISGKLLDSMIIGLLCYIGMFLLNIPFALLISVIVGVTNIIPYFGPFIGAIPSILLLLMVDPMKALWFAIFILVLQQIDGNIIGPKILGDSTGLPAFWVIFAVTVFGGFFGFFGMLVGVPLFAVIYMLVRRSVNQKLEKKQLSVATESYASPENPLMHKGEKVEKPAHLGNKKAKH